MVLNRNNFKWSVNEILSLQREYELLQLPIQDIATKHGRTVASILYKLKQEEFIESLTDVTECSKTTDYSFESLDYETQDSEYEEEEEDDSDYEDVSEEEEEEDDSEYEDISSLSQRVWNLETAVTDIRNMVEKLFNKFTTQ